MRQIQPHEVKNALDAGEPVVLIDVREPQEYAICRIEGRPLGLIANQPRRIAGVIDAVAAFPHLVSHSAWVKSVPGRGSRR